jgi:putative oxidoreductase
MEEWKDGRIILHAMISSFHPSIFPCRITRIASDFPSAYLSWKHLLIDGGGVMKPFDSITSWTDAHHPKWFDVLRMLLGVILFFKGLTFILDKELTLRILHDNNFEFFPLLVVHYVIIFQMAHSVLITFGLVTRYASAAQIPIVLGAIVLIATDSTFQPLGSDLWLAVLLLFLLLFFFIYGAGPLSVDAMIKRRRDPEKEALI